jgi:hypothetical protein
MTGARTTLQQVIGCPGEPASATDEDTLPSTGGSITAERVDEQIAGGAQGGKVSRRAAAVRVGGASRSTERSAELLLTRIGTNIE